MNRRSRNSVFRAFALSALFFCGLLLLFLFGTIAWKGISAIDLNFLFTPMSNFGAEGGIIYQIAGSILLVVVAALIAFPLALGTAIYKSEYIHNRTLQRITSVLVYGLNGIPSVIFGIFSLIFFANYLDFGISWFVGSITLAIMIVPTITLTAYQSVKSVPTIYREAGSALGLTKWEVVRKVIIPQGINGAITGLLIGIARAIGETAPIMFVATAFSGVEFPSSIYEPVSSLPTHILALAQQATNPKALANAWGSSFVLITLVMVFGITGLYLRIKTQKIIQR